MCIRQFARYFNMQGELGNFCVTELLMSGGDIAMAREAQG